MGDDRATLEIWGDDVLQTVEAELARLDVELRQLNLDIHGTCPRLESCSPGLIVL